jgi:adenine phosphoribosyltransferase
MSKSHLAAAIAAAPNQLITAPDGSYSFRVFEFGERGSSLSSNLIQEIGHGLCDSIRENYPGVEAVVSPEPGGHMWGLLTAFQLGLECYVLRAPSQQIPSSAAAVARKTAFSRGELLMPSIRPGRRVVIVDDVVSSGGTLVTITQTLRHVAVDVVGAQLIVAKGQAWRALEQAQGLRVSCLQAG